ncbi:MAG: hypothetical protein ACYC3S_14415 [Chloroflexota bacterium]
MVAKGRFLLMVAVGAALLVALAIGVMSAGAAAPQGTALISAPAANAQLRGSVTVQGTATATNFQFYKLEVGVGASPTSFSVIGDLQKSQVTGGTLGTWDTTKVPDGAYTLKLTVVDNTGNYLEALRAVTVGNTAPAAAPEAPRRGCLACHVKVSPDGRYTLAFEAKERAAAAGATHPTTSPSGVSIAPTDQTGIGPCLECHAPGQGARAGKGNIAPIALRDIVHPAHLFSTTFKEHYNGGCFTCHNVNGEGGWDVLQDKVDVNEKGVPQTLPIPGARPAL